MLRITIKHTLSAIILLIFNGIVLSQPLHMQSNFSNQSPKEKVVGELNISSNIERNLVSYGADVTNGNLILSENDINWFLFESKFKFIRTYNNQSSRKSKFGNKWSHNFEIYIEYKNEELINLNIGNYETKSFRKIKSKDFFISDLGSDTLLVSNDSKFFIITERGLKLEFNKLGFISKITDVNNNSNHFLYNKNNQLQIIIDPVGRELIIEYNSQGLISSLTGPDTKSIKYIYSSKEVLTKVEYPDGTSKNYDYNSFKQLSSIQDINTAIYRFKYSKSGKIRSIVNPLENTEYFDFKNFPGNKCIYTDGENNKWVYNTEGDKITKIKYPDGRHVSFTWNKNGQLIEYSNTEGQVSKYLYQNNKLTAILNTEGELTALERDANGNLIHYTSSTEELTYEYNSKNQIITSRNITDLLNEKYKRNLWGLISELEIEDQKFNAYFDTNGNILKIKSPQGMEIYKYDVMGNMISYADTLNNTFTASFDEMNRVKNILFADNLILDFTYDNAGNLIRITGPDGKHNDYKFDKLNRLIEEINGSKRYIYYDKSGNPLGRSKNEDGSTNLIISGQINQAGIRFSLDRHILYNISEQIKAGKSIISIPITNEKRIMKYDIYDEWVIFFNL